MDGRLTRKDWGGTWPWDRAQTQFRPVRAATMSVPGSLGVSRHLTDQYGVLLGALPAHGLSSRLSTCAGRLRHGWGSRLSEDNCSNSMSNSDVEQAQFYIS